MKLRLIAAALAVCALAACTPTPGPAPSSSSRTSPSSRSLVSATQEQRSPSGHFVAAYVVDGSTFVPVIRDALGQQVWADTRQHSTRFGAGVLWQHEGDVLWVLSRDLGNGRVEQRDGVWTYVAGSEGMPAEVRAYA